MVLLVGRSSFHADADDADDIANPSSREWKPSANIATDPLTNPYPSFAPATVRFSTSTTERICRIRFPRLADSLLASAPNIRGDLPFASWDTGVPDIVGLTA
jgi:hypothetical protein